MVRVCDAIMGSGKSSAAITHLNEHPNEKYIYITPYLDEADRIQRECPELHFVTPSNKIGKYDFKKLNHTTALIQEGRNIATTHQAFKNYTPETLEEIRSQGYILFIDENVDVLEQFDFHTDDIQIAVDSGYVVEHDGVYSLTDGEYSGKAFTDLFRMLKSRDLIRMTGTDGSALFYWNLSPELITSFKDVFIMTYLFNGQSLHHLLEIYHIPYEYIGVERTDNRYRFCKYPGHVPKYVSELKNKLYIMYDDRLNSVGSERNALSMNWFKQQGAPVKQLRDNIYNYFNNYFRHVDNFSAAENRLWGTYQDAFNKIKGKGYTKAFLAFNARATNNYRDKTCLAYPVNIYMNVGEKSFYRMHGIEVDEDMYALSIMVQWIWRSAIRDGKEIILYIPSSRMRSLLENWIDTVSNGGNDIV